jgi:hypothetical protein
MTGSAWSERRRASFAAVLLVSCAATTAQAQPAAVVQTGDCGVVLMQDGEIFVPPTGPIECRQAQGPWASTGNLFILAGRGQSSVAGTTTFAHVIAANGDWFQLGSCGASSTFQGNLYELAGMSPGPGEEFVTVGGGTCIGVEYAVTNLGGVYRWQACMGWMYLGSLPIAPTEMRSESWGSLKARFR